MEKADWQKVLARYILLACLCFGIMLFRAYLDGKFHSVETLKEYIAGFGAMAPVILTIIQAAQVIVPVLPDFLGCAVGAVFFGGAGGSAIILLFQGGCILPDKQMQKNTQWRKETPVTMGEKIGEAVKKA